MSNKKSCDLVRQGVAGPTADQILDSIRTEFGLPAKPLPQSPRATAAQADAQPDQPDSTARNKQVMP